MKKEHRGYEGNTYIDYYLSIMREFPEKQAVTCLTRNITLTYGELDKVTNQLNHQFRADGLNKTDVVMVCLFNTWEFPSLMIASWKTPCVFSPVNFRLAPGELAIHLQDSEPKVFVWDSALDESVKKALDLSSHRPEILLSTGESKIEGSQRLSEYYIHSPDSDPECDERVMEIIDPFNDEILRLYTSGTTGNPKGTIETSAALIHMDWSIIAMDDINWLDRGMNITPWFHQGGIILPTTILLSGGHLFGFPLMKFDSGVCLDFVEKYKLTVLWGAPVTFNSLAETQQKNPRDLGSLRLIQVMGSTFSVEEYQSWQNAICKRIYNGYGTTETRMDVYFRSDIHPPEKVGTTGRPAHFCQVRVVKIIPGKQTEPTDVVEKDGQAKGQVITKSTHQCLGYYNRPELQKQKLYKGWFYSGDVATWDKDGFITITGRADDMIQSGAENIYPAPVEESLLRCTKVKDAFVVPMPHKKWGQAVVAYVVPEDGESLSIEELDEHCLNDPYLASYTRPRYYQIVNELLPYTATGKKLHYKMSERARNEIDRFIPIPSERKNVSHTPEGVTG